MVVIANPTNSVRNSLASLDNTIFMKYKVINKGCDTIEDMYVLYWLESEIGSSPDDLIGCVPDLDLAIDKAS